MSDDYYPYIQRPSAKTIAITLDDGPNEPYTSDLLDFLDEVDVKVTLFQVGRCIRRYPEVTYRAFQSGHTIGNHSYSHEMHKYALTPRMHSQIDHTQALIRDITGKTPLLFRAPWFLHTPSLRNSATRRSLTLVKGELPHPIEIFQPDAKSIAGHAIKKARPGAILIFHDGYRWRTGYRGQTIQGVKLAIAELRRQGYTFVPAHDILQVPAYLEDIPKSANLRPVLAS